MESGVRTPAMVMTIDNRKKIRMVRSLLCLAEVFLQKLVNSVKPSCVISCFGFYS